MKYKYLTLNFDAAHEFLKANKEAEARFVEGSRWIGIDVFLANKITVASLLTSNTVKVRIPQESAYKVGDRFMFKGENYIFAAVGWGEYAMINLESGWRRRDRVTDIKERNAAELFPASFVSKMFDGEDGWIKTSN